MRILHVITSLDARTGGVAVALLGMAQAQASAGLTVSVATHNNLNDDPLPIERLRQQGVNVQLFGPVGRPLLWPHGSKELLGRQLANADVVHIHGLWEEILHRAARGAGATPYIISPHGMLDPWSLRQSRWRKRIYIAVRLRRNLGSAAALHFTTAQERDLVARFALKSGSIIEPCGVDLGEFADLPPGGDFRKKYPILLNRKLIIFMSRIHPKKGLDLLVPAFSKLKDRDAVLAIAGPDSDGYQHQVESMVKAHGVQHRVVFTGMLRGVDRLAALADADLFVLPSYQENFGVVVVEALAAGTPVIISDQVNLYPDVLAAEVGEVVPTDVDRLAGAMDRWLADETLRRSAGEKARLFARARYDWRSIAGRWKEHYAALIGRPSASAGNPAQGTIESR